MTVVPLVPSPPEPQSPRWWVDRLYRELQGRQADIVLHRRYVSGDHDEPAVHAATASQTFRRMMGLSKTNLTGLIVEATAERLGVQGFRFGDSPDADDLAWRIWQASDFDAASELAMTEALTVGRSFVLVEPSTGGALPRLYAEDASQVIVAYAPGRRTERLAALKTWTDEWTTELHATLYLPDVIYKLRTPAHPAQPLLDATKIRSSPWVLRDERIDGEPNPLGAVPVFELTNRPGLYASTVRSEVADVLGDQDACNEIALDALVAAFYGAFRQKWATGIEVPRDPATGNPIEPFDVAVNRILIAEGDDAKFGDFNATDLKPYIDLYESRVRHMAAVTRTPVSILLGGMVNISAEALALSVSGHVNKVKRRWRHYEQAFESALRAAFTLMGDERATVLNAETIWVDPEIKSVAQAADAATKLVQSGVITAPTAQELYLGLSETQRSRDDAWRQAGQLADPLAGLTAMLDAQSAEPAPQDSPV